ncbi:DUF6049 family protein [Nonomuraea sp. NPDC050328]|uniref:DUF6049 family protein n=1 Tax=Nonomuraea sp. NPDC050328 TaxID=3364361 RepID=UPI0037ACF687
MTRKLTLLAVLSAALLAPFVATPAGTAAAETAQQAQQARQETRLAIRSITPDVPRTPTTEIKISGSITNRGEAALQRVRIGLRTSSQRFTSRAELEVYQTGQAIGRDVSWGVGSTELQAPLEPGASATFELIVTPAQLQFGQFGVYPLSVEASDLYTGQPVDTWRSFLTYAPTGPAAPKLNKTKLAFALPIIDEPHRTDTTTFLDNDLAAGLEEKGQLTRLLQLAQSAPKNVTWFVEPSLLDDLATMSAAHQVRIKGKVEDRPADARADAWLKGLRTALAGVPVVAVPYADPDVVALAHQGLDRQTGGAIEKAAAVVKSRLERGDVSTAANWPAGGLIDADALDVLAISKVDTVLLSPENLPARQQLAATPAAAAPLDTVAGVVTALVPDQMLSRTLEQSGVQSRQRFVAETALIAAEPAATSVVVAPQRRWDPNPQHVTALLKTAATLPWVSVSPLGSIKPAKGTPPRADLNYTDDNRAAELDQEYLARVKKVADEARLTAEISPGLPQSGFEEAILRLTSAGWRKRLKAAESARKSVHSRVKTRHDLVTVPGTGTDQSKTLAGTDGLVPISVTNGRKENITVLVSVTSGSKDLVIEDYEPKLTIDANQSGTIPVPMRVKTSGDATVSVQLLTKDGVPYGEPSKLVIRTTGYTGVALVIVGGALAVMLAAVVMRVLRRRSEKRVARSAQAREAEVV